jgi:hypothetical protein
VKEKPCKHCGSLGHHGVASMTNLCEHIQLINSLRKELRSARRVHKKLLQKNADLRVWQTY